MQKLIVKTDERGVTRLTLNRPARRNALDIEILELLPRTLAGIQNHTRVLVLEGAGEHFCAGADIDWMRDSGTLGVEQNTADAMVLSHCLDSLNRFPRPTIAKVQGAAIGGGTGLVCCADVVIAAESARFGFSEVRLGIIPATISPYALAAIGPRQARRYFLSGEPIDAVEAYRIGLVHNVCSTDNLNNRVEQQISELLKGGPAAQMSSKALINDINGQALSPELQHGLAQVLADIRTGDEAQEGLSAFLEKRPPSWHQ